MRSTSTPGDLALGRNIRAEMYRRGVTQQTVAGRLGLTQTAVSARLRGKTSWRASEVVAVAELLGVSVESLLVEVAA